MWNRCKTAFGCPLIDEMRVLLLDGSVGIISFEYETFKDALEVKGLLRKEMDSNFTVCGCLKTINLWEIERAVHPEVVMQHIQTDVAMQILSTMLKGGKKDA